MSIVIGCDSFLALRNVRNGELGRRLEEVEVWVDPHQLKGSLEAQPEGVTIAPLIDFDFRQDQLLEKQISRTYEARKSYRDGWTLWHECLGSIYRGPSQPAWRRAVSVGMAGVRLARGWCRGAMGQAGTGRELVGRLLQERPEADQYMQRFEQLDCRAVAGFSPEGFREMLLVESANRAHLPTAVMIRSRDNISAKIQHLPLASVYLVWSEATRQSLLAVYPEIDPARVIVTGSPQFDRHLNPAYRMEREAFFGAVGLDPDRPLIVYTMATPGLAPHEIDIVQHLADAAHAGQFSQGAQLLVRGHPRMFGSAIPLLHREWPEARAYPAPARAPYNSPTHEAEVVRLILEDEPMHLATLACQDVQVNICGTMTIDSAILDKPTIHIFYDLVRGIPFALSVRRFYERTDVKEMIAYGASRLAASPEQCIDLINEALANPAAGSEGRRRAREQDCGPLDGSAGIRIAAALKELRLEKAPAHAIGR